MEGKLIIIATMSRVGLKRDSRKVLKSVKVVSLGFQFSDVIGKCGTKVVLLVRTMIYSLTVICIR